MSEQTKTSAELVDGFVWLWGKDDLQRRALRQGIVGILAAHRREVEAEWKEEAGEAYASGYRDGVASVDVVAPPKHAGDPAKADTCGNCGALAWSDPAMFTLRDRDGHGNEYTWHELLRSCTRSCGRVERFNGAGGWEVWQYPGKGAHTEGEER